MMRRVYLFGGVMMMLALASCSKTSNSSEEAGPATTKPAASEVSATEERPVGNELSTWLNEQHTKLPVGELAILKLRVKDADTIIFATANVTANDLSTEWPMISPEAVSGIVAKMQTDEGPLLFLLQNNKIQCVVKLKSDATLEGSFCKGWAVENGEAEVSVMKNKVPYAPYVALQFQ